MRIVVFPGVLRPPSDAALLGGVMARHADRLAGGTVLDLCSGAGILGLTGARLGARATAGDPSRRAGVHAPAYARLPGPGAGGPARGPPRPRPGPRVRLP